MRNLTRAIGCFSFHWRTHMQSSLIPSKQKNFNKRAPCQEELPRPSETQGRSPPGFAVLVSTFHSAFFCQYSVCVWGNNKLKREAATLVCNLVFQEHSKEWEKFCRKRSTELVALLLVSALRAFAKTSVLRALALLKRAAASLLLIIFTKGKGSFCCTLNGQRLVAILALS